MDQALKNKWLEALRSGQYKQGQHCLRMGDKYCCLGVLCDISGEGQWTLDGKHPNYWYSQGNSIDSLDSLLDADRYSLPEFVRGVTQVDDNDEEKLTSLNDDEGQTFDQIADWIEENIQAI